MTDVVKEHRPKVKKRIFKFFYHYHISLYHKTTIFILNKANMKTFTKEVKPTNPNKPKTGCGCGK